MFVVRGFSTLGSRAHAQRSRTARLSYIFIARGGKASDTNSKETTSQSNGAASIGGTVFSQALSAQSSENSKIKSVTCRFLSVAALAVGSTKLSSIAPANADSVGVMDLPSAATSSKLDHIVIKRPTDERTYKAITLPSNGLRVLLISDPTSSRSAAALDVHAGAFSDPIEVPGIAHFCEHMTFLGTKKYPDEDGFSTFLNQNGGSSNAYTDSEDTVYYFDVNAEHLKEGLDRFAGFFEAPLFTPSATARELNAIESEHAKNVNSDGFRLYQLQRDMANPKHPLNKFATGNKFTLETNALAQGIDIREKLLEFHGKYYTSRQMTLSVLGKQGISELEAWVTKSFAEIPDSPEHKKVADPEDQWWGKEQPYLTQTAASLIEVVPVSPAMRALTISWPVWIQNPEERKQLLFTRPETVISHLIGHESEGSLRSLLVNKGWVNGVQASVGNDVADMQMFEIGVDLTEAGLKHRDEIVDTIFSYLDLMKTQDIPQYVYQEIKSLCQIGFNFAEKNDPASYVSGLVTNMQLFDKPRDYIIGSRLFDHGDRESVTSYLSSLNPTQAQIRVVSSEFDGKTTEKARYYGTQYNKRVLTKETKRWEKVKASDFPALTYPLPNDLIPENFDLVHQEDTKKKLTQKEKEFLLDQPPNLIREDDKWAIWYKVDKSFKQPKVYAVISLALSKDIYDKNFVVNAKIFSSCFIESLTEYMYNANLAGINVNVEFTSRGVQVIFSGFNDKLEPFAREVLQKLKTYRPDKATYERIRDLLEREYSSWATQQPYQHAAFFAGLASETLQFKIEDMQKTIKNCNINMLDDFLVKALAKSYGTAMVIGNANEDSALQLTKIVEEVFPFAPQGTKERSFREVVEYPLDTDTGLGYRIAKPEPNNNDENSATAFYFQLPSRAPKDYVNLEMLSEVLEQPFYNSLRTQQQLGYIVYSGIKVREGVCSLAFVVQSSILDGERLTKCVEKFMKDEVPGIIDGLTADTLEPFRDGLIVRKLEPDQRLTSQAGRFWGEILASMAVTYEGLGGGDVKPLFDRHNVEVSELKKISVKGFQKFAREFLLPEGQKRRLLVSQITSIKAPKEEGKKEEGAVSPVYINVSDEVAFREKQTVVSEI